MWSILGRLWRRRFLPVAPGLTPRFFGVWLAFLLGIFALVPQGVWALDASTLTETATANFILLIAQAIQFLTGALGSLVLIIIDILTVYILGYNGFSESAVISLGWSLVRDVVNMFVVLILLFIAIRTILGLDKSSWQQSLPRLFLAVVLVNFSRTICGLLIDFSQLVMFTFVNALIEIAAGNFAQMLGLQNYGLLSMDKVRELGNDGKTVLTSANILASAYLQLALYGAIVAVLLMLTLAFLWRIIVLWILVIMSPLAFFMNSMKDVVSFAGGVGGQWWNKFTAALTLGPLLAFFLWLSLAAASSGGVAVSGGFETNVESESYGNAMLESLETDNVFALLLALALLVVGMQQAASSAQSLGGIAGTVINEGVGKKIVGGALTLPIKGAGYAAYGVDRGGGRFNNYLAGKDVGKRFGLEAGSGRLSTDLVKRTAAASLGTARAIQGVPIIGAAAGGLAAIGGSLQDRMGSRQSEEMKGAREQIKTESTDEYAINAVQMMSDLKAGRNPVTAGGNRKHDGRMTDFIFNPAQQKKAQDLLTAQNMAAGFSEDVARTRAKKQTDGFIADAIADLDANGGARKGDLLDEAGRTKFNDLKSRNLHLLQAQTNPDGTTAKSKAEVIRDFVKSTDFNASRLSDDAVNNKDVQAALSLEKDRNVKDNTTYLERIRDGKYTARVKPSVTADDETRLVQAFSSGQIAPDKITSVEMTGANGDSVVSAMLASPQVNATVMATIPSADRLTFNERAKRQPPDRIREGIKNGSVSVTALNPSDIATGTPTATGRNMASAVLLSSPATIGSITNRAVRAGLLKAVEDLRNDATFTVSQATQAEENLLAAGEGIDDVIDGVDLSTGNISSPARPRVAQLIARNPVNTRHLTTAINVGGSNDATAAVVSTITKEALQTMAARFRDAVGAEQGHIRDAMRDIGVAIAQEKAAARSGAEKKRLAELETRHIAASRYM